MLYNVPFKKNRYQINKEKRFMNIYGQGKVKTYPDLALITLGVITENINLEVAQKENTIKTRKIFEALYGIGINDEDIETKAYTIKSKYNIEEGKKIFIGYEVTNKFEITVKNIQNIGEVIDLAVRNGANYANQIKFDVLNPSIYYRKALALAVENAVKKAKDIGRTLDNRVNETPYKIIEENYNSVYLPYQPSFRSPELDTPISAGQLEFVSKIKAEFRY